MAWLTQWLPAAPSQTSPGGDAEIRHLIRRKYGDVTHVRVPAGTVSAPAWLDVAEFFYVHAGRGQMWRRRGDREEVIELVPGTCAGVLPGTVFQYRASDGTTADSTDLVVVLVVVPSWQRGLYHLASIRGAWNPTNLPAEPQDPPPVTLSDATDDLVHLRRGYDGIAPDGSRIRLLLEVNAGGVAHCELPAGGVTVAVKHQTVNETWFVLDGAGELWRAAPSEVGPSSEEVTSLHHGVCVDIPLGTVFQFRTTGIDPLQLLLLTAPPWPGPGEAVAASPQRWTPTVIPTSQQ